MALTVNVVSGSVANNNLVISLTGATARVTMSVGSSGNLIFSDGTTTVATSYAPANFASAGVPVTSDAAGAASNTMSAATFNTAGLIPKLAAPAPLIDAVGASQADIAGLVANKANIGTSAISNASITSADFAALAGKFVAGGALQVDATGATLAQINAMITGVAQIASGGSTNGVSNAVLTYAQFDSLDGVLKNAGAVSVDMTNTVITTGAGSVLENLTNNAAKLASGSIENVSTTIAIAAGAGGLLSTIPTKLGTWALVEVDAAVASTTDMFAALANNRTLVAQGALVNVNPGVVNVMTPGQFTILSGKVADGEIGYMNLTNQTVATVASVVAGAAKFGVASITGATLTPAQFVQLEEVDAVATGGASVNASGATTAQVDVILSNTTDFAAGGLSYLTLTADQFGAITPAEIAAFTASLSSVSGQTLTVNANAAGSIVNAQNYSNAMTLAGSNNGDVFLAGTGATTMRGAQGNDSLVGGSGADSIVGGAGNDTMTGGGAADTFVVNAGSDTVTDLNSTDGDILVVSAGATATANNATLFVATSSTSNNGAATINTAAGGTAGAGVNVSSAVGSNGWALNGNVGADSLTGSANADVLAGGAGNDTLVGGAGADTLRGGAGSDTLTGDTGNDVFQVNAGSDTVTDLGTGTGDVLVVSSGATATATVAASYTATAATSNSGTATINQTATGTINMSSASGTSGYAINGAAGAAATITGSVFADTITGGTGNNVLRGNLGNDSIVGNTGDDVIYGGQGNDTMTGGTGVDVFFANAGTDTITDLAAGADQDVIQVSSGVIANATVAAGQVWTATGASVNEGTLNVTVGLASGANLSNIVTTSGVNFTATVASTVVGSNLADTFTGGAGIDDVTLLAGRDVINLAADAVIDVISYTTAITSVGSNGINADIITGLGATDLIEVAGAVLGLTTTGAETVTYANVADATSVADISAVYAAIAANASYNSLNFAASVGSGGAVNAQSVTFANGAAAGTYLVINNGVAGFQAANDFVVKVGMASGAPLAGTNIDIVA